MPFPRPPVLSYSDIVARSEQILKQHGVADDVPLDIEAIIDVRYRIDVFPRHGLMDQFQIDAYISSDLTEIAIDEGVYNQKSRNRLRFSLAHEFAHLILHEEIYRAMAHKSPQEWRVAMESLIKNEYEGYDWLEWQANTFAGLVLVPPHHLRRESNAIREKMKLGGLDTDEMAEAISDRVVRMLGEKFAVSTAVIRNRLQKDKCWPWRQET